MHQTTSTIARQAQKNQLSQKKMQTWLEEGTITNYELHQIGLYQLLFENALVFRKKGTVKNNVMSLLLSTF
jgi:hypothetical protein